MWEITPDLRSHIVPKRKKNHFGPFEKYKSLNINLFGQDG